MQAGCSRKRHDSKWGALGETAKAKRAGPGAADRLRVELEPDANTDTNVSVAASGEKASNAATATGAASNGKSKSKAGAFGDSPQRKRTAKVDETADGRQTGGKVSQDKLVIQNVIEMRGGNEHKDKDRQRKRGVEESEADDKTKKKNKHAVGFDSEADQRSMDDAVGKGKGKFRETQGTSSETIATPTKKAGESSKSSVTPPTVRKQPKLPLYDGGAESDDEGVSRRGKAASGAVRSAPTAVSRTLRMAPVDDTPAQPTLYQQVRYAI